jgi:hypothetical protein
MIARAKSWLTLHISADLLQGIELRMTTDPTVINSLYLSDRLLLQCMPGGLRHLAPVSYTSHQ